MSLATTARATRGKEAGHWSAQSEVSCIYRLRFANGSAINIVAGCHSLEMSFALPRQDAVIADDDSYSGDCSTDLTDLWDARFVGIGQDDGFVCCEAARH